MAMKRVSWLQKVAKAPAVKFDRWQIYVSAKGTRLPPTFEAKAGGHSGV